MGVESRAGDPHESANSSNGAAYSGFMKEYLRFALALAAILVAGTMASTRAQNIQQEKSVGKYRFELEVLPPEPFYTQAQVDSDHVQKGMLVIRGASPVGPNAPSMPDHHLVVHLFDRTTGKAVTGAAVEMTFQTIDSEGRPVGPAHQVPVVEMQVIGKGPSTTHYGNNVNLPGGKRYQVRVTANGVTATFDVRT